MILLLSAPGTSVASLARPILAQANPADDLLERGKNFLAVYSYRQAAQQFEQAAQRYQAAGDSDRQQIALLNLGLAQYRLGAFRQAIRTLDQAERLPVTPTTELRSRWLLLRGLTAMATGDLERGLTWLNQVQYVRDLNIGPQRMLGLAEGYRYQGQYSRALDTVQTATNIAHNRTDRVLALTVTGDIYLDLGDWDEAAAHYTAARQQAEALGDAWGRARSLMGLGQVYHAQGELSAALEVYQLASSILRGIGNWEGLGRAQSRLGAVYLDQQQWDESEAAYTEALSYSQGNGLDYGRNLSGLGRVAQMRGDLGTALELYTDGYAWSESHNDATGVLFALGRRAEVALQRNDLSAAKADLQLAIEHFESLKPGLRDSDKVSLFETQSYLYEQLQRVLVAQGEPESALVVAEQGRARALAELLGAEATHTDAAVSIAALRSLAATHNQTLVQYSVLRQPSPSYTQFTDQQLYVWVVTPAGDVIFETVDLSGLTAPLAEQVAGSRAQLGVRGAFAFTETLTQAPRSVQAADTTLRELHQLLIEPIAEHLPDAPEARVVISPQRSLFLVPFAALTNEQGQALIEQHTLAISPSLHTQQLLQQRATGQTQSALVVGVDRSSSRPAVIVGNPKMPTVAEGPGKPAKALTPLPGAETEARAIAPLLSAEPLVGDAATETAVRSQLETASIIHLATHGLLDDQQALQSALALTPEVTATPGVDSPNDGLLTVGEIMQLQLSAELVVLSACNTGRGHITGDGVMGLSRAFLAAGTDTLVASLWAVPDQSTAALMTAFYEQLQTEPDAAVALRRAMLTTRQTYPHPQDWAAFFVMGQ